MPASVSSLPDPTGRALARFASFELQSASLKAWQVGEVLTVARDHNGERAPQGPLVPNREVVDHAEHVDALLAAAAALLREVVGELKAADERMTGREDDAEQA